MKAIPLKKTYDLKKIGNSFGFIIRVYEVIDNELEKYDGFNLILQPIKLKDGKKARSS
ncbi:MAG: hypothetical protein ACFFG0_41825 [Candidatus Thorarchaeota archaeon]